MQSQRIRDLLAELERQVESARRHEDTMEAAFHESRTWSDPEDRDWVDVTFREATQERVRREVQLAEARQMVARASEGVMP